MQSSRKLYLSAENSVLVLKDQQGRILKGFCLYQEFGEKVGEIRYVCRAFLYLLNSKGTGYDLTPPITKNLVKNGRFRKDFNNAIKKHRSVLTPSLVTTLSQSVGLSLEEIREIDTSKV